MYFPVRLNEPRTPLVKDSAKQSPFSLNTMAGLFIKSCFLYSFYHIF
ncbi:hypothetical protein HMPREF3213_02052 [Heyndrickxia coagulans]|uniref:Uncharacterized protein n=1 Tax=Heyndrickxia coagulans TaxID=1398 RepID=A0A0C5CD92_HEYCO|nr:hypothetical protein SB48_HM08orf06218 [Heyndrickxia coagulans]KWZ81368.1 hypothetical protein HMPREF3213_02052 [Heyndrickxia coagulans]